MSVRIKAILIHPKHDVPVLFLANEDDSLLFSMIVGFLEAQMILIGWKKLSTPRPVMADLLQKIVQDSFSARVKHVLISDVREGAFISSVAIQHDDRIIEHDCRPSDALALAVRVRVPLYVSQRVINAVAHEQENTKALMAYLEAEMHDQQNKKETPPGTQGSVYVE